MKFSVLMSVYQNDNAAYLRKALESISENQTYKPTQIVLVEDGALTEELCSVISEFSQVAGDYNIEFTLVCKEKNGGLAAALNDGLKVCKYEWVARMDADDISTENRFEKQISFIEKNPKIALVGGYISEFYEEVGDCTSIRKVALEHKDILKMMKIRTPFNHTTVMYKKASVLEAGGYSENIGRLEDYCLWVNIVSNGTLAANLPEILAYVRIGNGFIKRRSDKREIKDWDMLQKFLLQKKIINLPQAILNKLYIRIFIYTPPKIKANIYRFFLRK